MRQALRVGGGGIVGVEVAGNREPLTRIAVCTPERDLCISGTFEGQTVDAPLPHGFSHFR